MTLTRRQFVKLGTFSAAGVALGAHSRTHSHPLLRILAAPGALHPRLLPAWTEATGVRGEVEVVPSAEALLAQLRARPAYYGLVLAPATLTPRLISARRLRPLDHVKLPAAAQLGPQFSRGRRAQDPANAFTLPAATGVYGLLSRSGNASPALHSWADLVSHAGTVAVPDDAQLVVGQLLRSVTGPALYASSAAHDLIRPHLARLRAHALITDDPIAAILERQADTTVGPDTVARWHGLAFAKPTEGASAWTVDYGIPVDAAHPGLAHEFVNFALAHVPPEPLRRGSFEPALAIPESERVARDTLWREAA